MKHRIDDGNQQTAHNPPYNLCTCMYSMNNPDSIHTIYTIRARRRSLAPCIVNGILEIYLPQRVIWRRMPAKLETSM